MMPKGRLTVSSTCQIPSLAAIYEQYFGLNGTFVEIGANDGEMASNTSCLADIGWHGKYVEPDIALAKQCMARHISNNVEVYCVAISDKEEMITLNHVEGGLSTASVETRTAHQEIEWSKDVKFIGSSTVQAVTLNRLLSESRVLPGFELLVVDVEGYEEKVFSGFSIDHFIPKMIIVELCDYHPSFKPFPELQMSANRVRQHILRNDYKQIYADPINTIFISNRNIK